MRVFKFLIFLILPICLFSSETVFLLHGFMRSSSSMNKMSRAFERQGYETCSWDYPSRDKTIEEHARDLVAELIKRAEERPNEPIHFVTHSMGGLIVRSALNHPKCPDEAKRGRVVLIAPPNQGSQFGRVLGHIAPMRKALGPKAGAQLLSHETFEHLGQFPDGVEVLVISGTFGWNPFAGKRNDGKVAFEESCLKTPHKHMAFFAGHSWIMYLDSVIYNAYAHISKTS